MIKFKKFTSTISLTESKVSIGNNFLNSFLTSIRIKFLFIVKIFRSISTSTSIQLNSKSYEKLNKKSFRNEKSFLKFFMLKNLLDFINLFLLQNSLLNS